MRVKLLKKWFTRLVMVKLQEKRGLPLFDRRCRCRRNHGKEVAVEGNTVEPMKTPKHTLHETRIETRTGK